MSTLEIVLNTLGIVGNIYILTRLVELRDQPLPAALWWFFVVGLVLSTPGNGLRLLVEASK